MQPVNQEPVIWLRLEKPLHREEAHDSYFKTANGEDLVMPPTVLIVTIFCGVMGIAGLVRPQSVVGFVGST